MTPGSLLSLFIVLLCLSSLRAQPVEWEDTWFKLKIKSKGFCWDAAEGMTKQRDKQTAYLHITQWVSASEYWEADLYTLNEATGLYIIQPRWSSTSSGDRAWTTWCGPQRI
jgi:hypothetical protein